MINQKALDRIEYLSQKYEYNWGKKVVLDNIPPGMSQEKLVTVLEYIVETGESVLVGWNKCFLNKR